MRFLCKNITLYFCKTYKPNKCVNTYTFIKAMNSIQFVRSLIQFCRRCTHTIKLHKRVVAYTTYNLIKSMRVLLHTCFHKLLCALLFHCIPKIDHITNGVYAYTAQINRRVYSHTRTRSLFSSAVYIARSILRLEAGSCGWSAAATRVRPPHSVLASCLCCRPLPTSRTMMLSHLRKFASVSRVSIDYRRPHMSNETVFHVPRARETNTPFIL